MATMASPCFGQASTEIPKARLAKLQSISLDDKILYTIVKIKEFYIPTGCNQNNLKMYTEESE